MTESFPWWDRFVPGHKMRVEAERLHRDVVPKLRETWEADMRSIAEGSPTVNALELLGSNYEGAP